MDLEFAKGLRIRIAAQKWKLHLKIQSTPVHSGKLKNTDLEEIDLEFPSCHPKSIWSDSNNWQKQGACGSCQLREIALNLKAQAKLHFDRCPMEKHGQATQVLSVPSPGSFEKGACKVAHESGCQRPAASARGVGGTHVAQKQPACRPLRLLRGNGNVVGQLSFHSQGIGIDKALVDRGVFQSEGRRRRDCLC